MSTILVVERSSNRKHSFVPFLERRGFDVYSVSTGKLAVTRSRKINPDLLILDAVSLGTSGERISSYLKQSLNGIPLIHLRAAKHAVGAENAGKAEVNLDMPFTARKLINRVHTLLPYDPDDILIEGPIRLNLKLRTVRGYGKEKRLTPKCTALLELFLRHPNETLNRKFLTKKVWKTDYVGDTRTLSVHVRWLRQAIERRPAKPRHLVTVRGIGYRFEPEPGAAGPTATGKQSRRSSTKRKS